LQFQTVHNAKEHQSRGTGLRFIDSLIFRIGGACRHFSLERFEDGLISSSRDFMALIVNPLSPLYLSIKLSYNILMKTKKQTST
jgi:hypothetical protein